MTSFDELLKMYEDEFLSTIRLGNQIVDHDLMALMILEIMQLRKEVIANGKKQNAELFNGLQKISRTFDPYYTKQPRR